MSDAQARLADKLVASFDGFVARARPYGGGDRVTLNVRVPDSTAEVKGRLWDCLWRARKSAYSDGYALRRVVDLADSKRPRLVVVFGRGTDLHDWHGFDPDRDKSPPPARLFAGPT